MFQEKLIGRIMFSRRGEYIGGRAVSEGGPGGHTTWWRGQGLGHTTLWCAWPLVPDMSILHHYFISEFTDIH
jgi:hypothetical protein